MIKFVGDLHFGHSNIRDFESEYRGHWKSTDEMNEGLIRLWNENISNDDTVYNLGDFFFNMKPSKIDAILDRLNFKEMILIAGNHDHSKEIKRLKKHGIEVKYADIIKRNGNRYYLSHYPCLTGKRKNLFNIHGHIHSDFMDTGYHINVDYDFAGRLGITFDEIEEVAKILDGDKNGKHTQHAD